MSEEKEYRPPGISDDLYEEDEIMSMTRAAIMRGDRTVAQQALVHLSTVGVGKVGPTARDAAFIKEVLLPAAIEDVGPASSECILNIITLLKAYEDRSVRRVASLSDTLNYMCSEPKSRLYLLADQWCKLNVTTPPASLTDSKTTVDSLVACMKQSVSAEKPIIIERPPKELMRSGLAAYVLAESKGETGVQNLHTQMQEAGFFTDRPVKSLWESIVIARSMSMRATAAKLWIALLVWLDPKFREFLTFAHKAAPFPGAQPVSAAEAQASVNTASAAAIIHNSWRGRSPVPDWALNLHTRRGRGYSTLYSIWNKIHDQLSNWDYSSITASHGVGVTFVLPYLAAYKLSNTAHLAMRADEKEADAGMNKGHLFANPELYVELEREYNDLVRASPLNTSTPLICSAPHPSQVDEAYILEHLLAVPEAKRSPEQAERVRHLTKFEAWIADMKLNVQSELYAKRLVYVGPRKYWFYKLSADWLRPPPPTKSTVQKSAEKEKEREKESKKKKSNDDEIEEVCWPTPPQTPQSPDFDFPPLPSPFAEDAITSSYEFWRQPQQKPSTPPPPPRESKALPPPNAAVYPQKPKATIFAEAKSVAAALKSNVSDIKAVAAAARAATAAASSLIHESISEVVTAAPASSSPNFKRAMDSKSSEQNGPKRLRLLNDESRIKGASTVSQTEFEALNKDATVLMLTDKLVMMSAPTIWLAKGGQSLIQGPFRTETDACVSTLMTAVEHHRALNSLKVRIVQNESHPYEAMIVVDLDYCVSSTKLVWPISVLSPKLLQDHYILIARQLFARCMLLPPLCNSPINEVMLVQCAGNRFEVIHGGMGSRIEPQINPNMTGTRSLFCSKRDGLLEATFFGRLDHLLTKYGDEQIINELLDLSLAFKHPDIMLGYPVLNKVTDIVVKLCSSLPPMGNLPPAAHSSSFFSSSSSKHMHQD